MTTLTFHVSRSIAAACQPGDEILVTALDHEANVSPWLAAAADHGLTVKMVDFRPDDCTLDLSDLERKLSSRTRLVAAGYASNAVGTLNPISQIAGMAHDVGAWLYVDAVHYAPHLTLDVAASGADFLVTSAYKWFGPHIGALWGRARASGVAAQVQGSAGARQFRDRHASARVDRRHGCRRRLSELIGRLYGGEDEHGTARRTALLEALRVIREHEARPAAQAGGGSAGTARRPSVGHHGRGALRRRASSDGIDHVCQRPAPPTPPAGWHGKGSSPGTGTFTRATWSSDSAWPTLAGCYVWASCTTTRLLKSIGRWKRSRRSAWARRPGCACPGRQRASARR